MLDVALAIAFGWASLLLVASEISSKNVDPRQRRMMRLLPIAFTAFIARFPADRSSSSSAKSSSSSWSWS